MSFVMIFYEQPRSVPSWPPCQKGYAMAIVGTQERSSLRGSCSRTIARGYIHGRGCTTTQHGENKHRHHYTDPEKQKELLQTVWGKGTKWASSGTFTTFCGKTMHTSFTWEQPPWSSLCKKCDKKMEMEKRKIDQILWENDAATEWEVDQLQWDVPLRK